MPSFPLLPVAIGERWRIGSFETVAKSDVMVSRSTSGFAARRAFSRHLALCSSEFNFLILLADVAVQLIGCHTLLKLVIAPLSRGRYMRFCASRSKYTSDALSSTCTLFSRMQINGVITTYPQLSCSTLSTLSLVSGLFPETVAATYRNAIHFG